MKVSDRAHEYMCVFLCALAGSTWTLRWRPQMRCCGKLWTLLSWSLWWNPCQEASVRKHPVCLYCIVTQSKEKQHHFVFVLNGAGFRITSHQLLFCVYANIWVWYQDTHHVVFFPSPLTLGCVSRGSAPSFALFLAHISSTRDSAHQRSRQRCSCHQQSREPSALCLTPKSNRENLFWDRVKEIK